MSRDAASRRRFLKLAVIAPLAGCMPEEEAPDPEDPTPAGPGPIPEDPVHVGHMDDFNRWEVVTIEGYRLAVGRDDDGLWAVSTQCTHLGCNIADLSTDGRVSFNGFECGCHGSRYDREGNVESGPSVRDLRNFSVAIDGGGEVFVDMTDAVPVGTRTEVS
jgi:cytochrome b6-f complex iron-sulfur subunit